MSVQDAQFMRHALRLAYNQLGHTGPNPAVGAVLVKDGCIVGIGVTQRNGRPHAETVAIAAAGPNAKGATLYVTLEPCAHTGETPSCADAIVTAGIIRTVIACTDPDMRTNGASIHRLHKAGLDVEVGIEEKAAQKLNAGFFARLQKQRPYVTVKLATTAGGHMQREDNERWITGENTRRFGHILRSKADMVLTGIGTVLSDDPMLDCRIKGLENNSPAIAILDSDLRLPHESQLVHHAGMRQTFLFCAEGKGASGAAEKLRPLSISVHETPRAGNGLDLSAVLNTLAQQGVNRLLVEAGPTLTQSFITANLADEMYWFQNPALARGDEKSKLADTSKFAVRAERHFGQDRLTIYEAA